MDALHGARRVDRAHGVAAGYPITPAFRLQSSVFADLPVRWLGWGQPTSVGLTFMVIRTFS